MSLAWVALGLAALQGAAGSSEGPVIAVPEGFVLERAAGPPLVERPMFACFDESGRLYVADSAGVNHKGDVLLKNPPHVIRVLEDTDGDGRFDTSRVFADRMVFPQGLAWYRGAVYVPSPPSLWKLEDTDGDGVCDRRTELLRGFATTGVADDVHGACVGPDGRIYFLPGRMAHDLRLPDGTRVRRAVGPWLMRCRPDGTDLEFVCGAIGNPVEVDWLPEGDFFISGTFWAPDSFGGGLRDAVIHGIEGGEWPVRDRTYTDRTRTGELLPVLVPMTATAPAGLRVARAEGPFEGNLFCAYFNTHRVQRHVLERDGASFRARTEEFVRSDHVDFHPTDVLEDADGSLLVVDTGGWFRIGCPTSQIAKPEVLGAIYRVRRRDAPRGDDPWGRKLDWSRPEAHLDDPRWAVRERAVDRAAAGEPAALERLAGRASPRARLGIVWALCRMDGPAARAAGRRFLSDPDARVRQAAAAAAGLHRDREAAGRLLEMLGSDAAPVRREAAAALGRIGDRRAAGALVEALRSGPDRYLEHAILYALIRLGDRDAVGRGLEDPDPEIRRGALIALDQMEGGGGLTPQRVAALLDPAAPALRQAAFRVIVSRPAWAKEVRTLAERWFRDPEGEPGRAEMVQGLVAAFAADSGMQDAAARALREPSLSGRARAVLLEALLRASPERFPATWVAEARWCLEHPDEAVARRAVAVLRAAGAADFDAALLALARDEKRSLELRVEALGAAAPRLDRLEGALFALLVSCLDPERPPLLRLAAAEAVGRAPLDDPQLERLALRAATAGPLELPRWLGAFERSRNASVGNKLLEALSGAPAAESVPAELLRRAIRNFPPEVRAAAGPILKRLEGDAESQKARLEELKDVFSGGDPARGREVFFGRRAGCTACHAAAGQGGRVGPDLSRIGAIRSPRDLLEAIVFPSASFARGYEPFVVRTRDGAVADGLVVRETPDAIYLFTADRTERRIPRAAIDELRQSRISIMPQGLDRQLSRDELRDLVAFLASLK
jgi:putative membrane-bound dehydrogenase-like protein